jgi:hypothetical protein
MNELKDDLDEARQRCDELGIEKIETEIEKLKQHGLSHVRYGKPKKLGDANEKIRKAVTKCIQESLAKIEPEHPDLWRHLDDALSLGVCCSYRPRDPVDWSE